MRAALRRIGAAVVAVAALAVAPAASSAAEPVSSGVGVAEVDGKAVLVEVLVRVAPGEDAGATTEQALRAMGARPIREQPQVGFALSAGGIHWPQFDRPPRKRQSVPMSYNPSGDTTGGAAGAAFTAASATWSEVRSSAFGFSDAGPTDRCPSIFCGGGLDYANDVGWLDLGSSTVLAATGIFFFFDSLEIIEADVAFNTAAGEFSTDGTAFDVETVMLHELGHVAGLGHVSDENALMYPFLSAGEVQRELTQSEIDGISYLYPKAAHPRPTAPLPPAPPVRASVVASLGDPAPAGGELAFEFEMGEVSDAGHAAFTTDVVVAGDTIGQAALRAGPSGLIELARSGGAIPSGGSFGLGTLGPVALTASGDAAFAFLTGPFEPPFGLNGGLFRSTLAGSTAELVTPGVTSTPAQGRLLGALEPDASDAGAVVFTGIVRSSTGGAPPEPPPGAPPPPFPGPPPPTAPPLAEGVFEVVHQGGVRAVAAAGDPAPGGGRFGYAAHPTTNVAGDVAFDAARGGCELEFRSTCRTGVYLRGATGGVEAVVLPEEQAPGGGPGRVRAAAGPVLNDAGDIAFAAALEDAGRVEPVEDPALLIKPITHALYLRSAGATREIVRTGDELPHGSHVWGLGGGIATGRPFWTLNDHGDVAFVATLTDSVFGDGVESNGVYVFDGSRQRLVARSGTHVIGLGTIRAIGTLLELSEGPEAGTSFFLLRRGGVALANNGDAVFPVTLTDGRIVLLRTRTAGG